jgi:NOL1/NOP2/fmu family ribosome biogenesis protein
MLRILHAWLGVAFYRWALAEINPLHPDLPRILRRRRELQDRLDRLLPARVRVRATHTGVHTGTHKS